MSKPKTTITASQIRAARALIDWSQEELAEASGLGVATIRKIESGHISPRGKTMDSIFEAFDGARVEFSPPAGVNLRDNEITLIDGEEANLVLLDDVYLTLHKKGGELLFWNADNSVHDDPIIQSELRLRKAGIGFRFLVAEGDTYLEYPLQEYRWLPKKFFKNQVQVVYGNKVALSMRQYDETQFLKKILIIESAALAESMRNAFNFIWENCRQPAFTTAEKTYT